MAEDSLYQYAPSTAAAILFTVLFGLSFCLHFYQMLSTRTWFLIPLMIGCAFEIVGYVCRAIQSHETPNWDLGAYIIQSLFILLAPALFAASVYMSLGRLIRSIKGEERSFVRPSRMTKIFVGGDFVSFMVQGTGGGVVSKQDTDPDAAQAGSYIIIGGLVIQLLFFGIFIIVACHFDRNMRKRPTAVSLERPWYKHLIMLYIVSILILVRSVFRIIEYAQGNTGYILSHEYFLYVFDAALMFGVVLGFNAVHPSEVKAWLFGGRYIGKGGFSKVESKPVSSELELDMGEGQKMRAPGEIGV